MHVFRPNRFEEICERLLDSPDEQIRIQGTGTKSSFLDAAPTGTVLLNTAGLNLITSLQPQDHMVTVQCGAGIQDVQSELSKHGQCLPLPDLASPLASGFPGTVGGLVAMNMPHGLEFQYGPPRDWVLKLDVLFDGQPAKSGAAVIKSVAGYDVHKALCGSMGKLGLLTQVTLRTWSLSGLQSSQFQEFIPWKGQDVWIVRTLRSDFAQFLQRGTNLLAKDPLTCTLWTDQRPVRPEEGWVLGPKGELWRDQTVSEIERRMKAVFDPTERWV